MLTIFQCTVKYIHIVLQQSCTTFFILQNLNSIAIKQQLTISPSPYALAVTILLSASMTLTALETLYKWSHTVFFFPDWLFHLA